MIRVTLDRKVYVLGCRLHHGLVGVALIAAGTFLIWDDRHDLPWWLRDR